MKDRFPGLRPFEKNDAELFFGREQEILQLSKLILKNKINVVSGPSGVGKSSLLNTAFLKNEALERYIPIKIRFTKQHLGGVPFRGELSHLKIIRDRIHRRLSEFGINYRRALKMDMVGPYRLWEYIKVAETLLAQAGIDQPMIFIFDQFEEFFSNFGDEQQPFCEQLKEVCHEALPVRLLHEVFDIPIRDRSPELMQWYSQTAAQFVFSMRSDKFYLLKSISSSLPTIYDNHFELGLFKTTNAQLAITGPTELPNGIDQDGHAIYSSPLMRIPAGVRHAIIKGLTNAFDEIDCSLLQIVCYYMEDKVKRIVKENGIDLFQDFEFNKNLFDQLINIDDILDRFYDRQIDKIGNEGQKALLHQTIEDHFISEGQRAVVLFGQLLKYLKEDKTLIDFLIRQRLIRTETVSERTTYELTHEKLIPAVQKAKAIRLEKEKLAAERQAAADKLQRQANDLLLQAQNLKKEQALKNEAIRELELAVQERRIARSEWNTAIREKEIAQKQRRQARVFLGYAAAAAILFVVGLLVTFHYLRTAKAALNTSLHIQAQNYYDENNHSVAFSLWDFHQKDLIKPAEQKNKATALSDLPFFDISGGDGLIALGDRQIAVHQKDNTIFLCKIDMDYRKISQSVFFDCANMIVSDNRRFLAYRNSSNGKLNVYDIHTARACEINGSEIHMVAAKRSVIQQNAGEQQGADYKMAFVSNSSLLSYIDAKGYSYLYDPVLQRSTPIEMLKNFKYTSQEVKDMYAFSNTGKYFSLKKRGYAFELYRWNAERPKFLRTVPQIRHLYNSVLRDSLIYLADNADLVLEPFEQKRANQTIIPFRKLNDLIMSSDGTKSLLLTNKNKLVVYNFLTKTIYDNIDGQHLLQTFPGGKRRPALKNIVHWADSGNRFSFRAKNGRIILQDMRTRTPLPVCDENLNCNYLSTYDGYRYIISRDGKKSAYIDKFGWVKVYNILSRTLMDSTKMMPDSIARGKGSFSLSAYNLDDIIKFSDDGSELACIRNFYGASAQLELINLTTKARFIPKFTTKKIGELFTRHYIQAISDYNLSGGLYFLNGAKRDLDYYRALYPPLTDAQLAKLGLNGR